MASDEIKRNKAVIARFVEEVQFENWLAMDQLSCMQQLGVLPRP